jgi:uncharacterized protein (DUF2141 family)
MSRILRISAAAAVGLVLVASGGASAEDASCTGHEGPVRLYVDVENIRSSEGLIAVTLYADDSKKFLAKRGSLYVGRAPAKAPETRVCIYLPKTGTYALGVYHDANGDRKFDRTGIGLPDEGYGFSNNPGVFLGLPKFKSVRLAVPSDKMSTRVRLRYP